MPAPAESFRTGSLALPWTRACFVCGQDNPHGLRARCRLEGGRAVLEHAARPADLGWRDFVHGGVTMALLDEAMAWAAMARSRRPCVTAELSARLRRPVLVGMRLRAEGEVVRAGPRMVLAAGRVLGEAGEELASATAKFIPMDPERSTGWLADLVWEGSSFKPEQLFDLG
ncbi:MAG: PaaI family thioesterase [Elusimicrobia bacterium]|nr:PaaI family thioesterase [Elusimicrobiota bacterium]